MDDQTKKWLVGIDTGSPYGWSVSADTDALLRRTVVAPGSPVDRFAELISAEIDLCMRATILNRVVSELAVSAEEHVEIYPEDFPQLLGRDYPEGYDAGGNVSCKETAGLAREAEAIVSLFLDGLYILTERIVAATIAVSERLGAIGFWPDIQVPRASRACKRGKASPKHSKCRDCTWLNLLSDFEAGAPGNHLLAENILRAREVRGSRTHRRHFQVYLETEAPLPTGLTPCFADSGPWRDSRAIVCFRGTDCACWNHATLALLGWWCQQMRRFVESAQQSG